MNNIRYYILGTVLIVIQLLISEYVNIWPMLYIAVYPVMLFVIPYDQNYYLKLATAFVFGFIIDIMAGDTLGINAAAATAVAFFRNPLMKLMLSKVSLEKISEINEKSLGLEQFALLSLLSYSIFFVFYMALDGWGYFSFGYTLLRFAANVLANSLIALLVWKTFIVRILR